MTKQKANSKRKKLEESSFSEADSPFKESGTSLIRKVEERIAAVMKEFEKRLVAKDSIITTMKEKIATLRKKVLDLEEKIDYNEAYERRDTVNQLYSLEQTSRPLKKQKIRWR